MPHYRNSVTGETVEAFRLGDKQIPEWVRPHIQKGFVVVTCGDATKPEYKKFSVYQEAIFDEECGKALL